MTGTYTQGLHPNATDAGCESHRPSIVKKLHNAKKHNLLISCAFSLALAGCAVSPVPLEQGEVASFVADKKANMFAGQEPVNRSIDMHEAMARALKYNLDVRVSVFEEALRIEESRLTSMDMLPKLVASGVASGRDSVSSSSSRSIITGRESLEPSTSSDRLSTSGDLTFSYNVLDFGLSYLRAQQAADRALIAEENRRKVANRIIEDVRAAYWRAYAAERLASQIPVMESRIGQVQRANAALRASGLTSPVAVLTFEREVIDLNREVRRMETELSTAKVQLASLMNIEPGTAFALVSPNRGRRALALPGTGARMVETALMNRAEIRELMLQQRINGTEAKAALVELLPGINAFVGANMDSNSFLTKGNWAGWGLRASWNLINIIRYPQKAATIDAQGKVIDQRAMAAAMAVMTQVHASSARFRHTGHELKVANAYLAVQGNLLRQVRAEAAAGKVSEQTVLREQMNHLIGSVRADLAHAQWQSAYAQVYSSIGVDPYQGLVDKEANVAVLAKSIRSSWFEMGKVPGGFLHTVQR
ncbi:MAG: TolC family protein [Beijerinckiaceae bacterium]